MFLAKLIQRTASNALRAVVERLVFGATIYATTSARIEPLLAVLLPPANGLEGVSLPFNASLYAARNSGEPTLFGNRIFR